MIDENSRVDTGPTTNVEEITREIDSISRDGYESPLKRYAAEICSFGVQYNVNPALFVAVVYYENWYGMYPNNGAWNPVTEQGSYNWASISNAYYGGWTVPGSRWGQYPNIMTGIEAFFKLISIEYYPMGQKTIGTIMWGIGGDRYTTGQHAYAPAFENRATYVDELVAKMNSIYAEGGCIGPPPPPPPPIQAPVEILSPAPLVAGGLMLLSAGILLAYRNEQIT